LLLFFVSFADQPRFFIKKVGRGLLGRTKENSIISSNKFRKLSTRQS